MEKWAKENVHLFKNWSNWGLFASKNGWIKEKIAKNCPDIKLKWTEIDLNMCNFFQK